MKITDYVDLFYPSAEAEEYAKKRQKKYENYPQDFMVNLETDNIAKLIAPMNFAVATSKMKEFTDDIETLNCVIILCKEPVDVFNAAEKFFKAVHMGLNLHKRVDTINI